MHLKWCGAGETWKKDNTSTHTNHHHNHHQSEYYPQPPSYLVCFLPYTIFVEMIVDGVGEEEVMLRERKVHGDQTRAPFLWSILILLDWEDERKISGIWLNMQEGSLTSRVVCGLVALHLKVWTLYWGRGCG